MIAFISGLLLKMDFSTRIKVYSFEHKLTFISRFNMPRKKSIAHDVFAKSQNTVLKDWKIPNPYNIIKIKSILNRK
jgi:hypothetical protein